MESDNCQHSKVSAPLPPGEGQGGGAALVFATNNAHKLSEVRAILGADFDVLGLSDIGCHEDIPETAETLEGNALQKALYVSEHYGCDCFADDTGLEVDALGGAPGVHTARYAAYCSGGADHDTAANVDTLLANMRDKTDRRARFRTVIALIRNGERHLFDGIVEGVILPERRGTEGFGYDPVFQPDGEAGSFAEIGVGRKNAISHRARATQKLAEFLTHSLARAILIIFLLAASVTDVAAQALGSWQVYPSYTTATCNVPVGSRIYALMENKLMAYDTEDQSIVTFDCMRQLHDVNVSLIDYSSEARRVILVYDNSNIDLLSTEDDADVVNMAQLKNSTRDVSITAMSIHGSLAYLSTNIGIVVIDMANAVILHTYDLQQNVLSAASDGTFLFAVTPTGVWRGRLTDNLQDPSSWTCVSTAIKSARNMLHFGGRVVCTNGQYLCWSSASGNGFDLQQKFAPTIFNVSGDRLIMANATNLDIYSGPGTPTHYSGTFTWNDLRQGDDLFWASDGLDGLQGYRLADDGTFQLQVSGIHPNSPIHDYAHHVAFVGGRLLVTGGSVNYGYVSHPGTAMYLEPDGTWVNFDYRGAMAIDTSDKFIDATDIAQDPQDPSHHYVATARDGIYEFRNAECVGHLTLGNSPLGTILPDDPNPKWFVVASGSRYDPDGNLWVLNSAQDTIIRIMRPDGTWRSLYYSEIEGTTAIDHLLFDSRGWAWMTSRRMSGRGLFCLQYNGTIDVQSDDRHFLRSQIINQDNTSYAPNEFYGIAEDHDGNIWFGTEAGPFVVSDPENYMSSDFTFEQVKVARNDGSGLADYLLANTPVSCIAIDGANRKWFGTQNNGVYLVSADCQEQIYHFTTENSPILSDAINGIAIDGETGKVVFATEKGLCSFMADATAPVESPSDDDVIAYPNPVRPDYHGPIAIKGLAENSDVKIVTSTGQIVWSGTSNGGMFTWDGCTASGRRVASGVYIVLATTPSGKQAVATKIAFIR